MDPSSTDHCRCRKLRKRWSLRPACHFRDRALASCFFCRRISSMLIQPQRRKQKRRSEDGSTSCLTALPCENLDRIPWRMKLIWDISCQIIYLKWFHWFPRFQRLKGQAAHIFDFENILLLVLHRIKNLGGKQSHWIGLGWKGGSGVELFVLT